MTIKLYIIARNQLGREAPSTERDNKKESLRIIVFVVICFLTLWAPSFVNIIVRQLTYRGLKFRNEATNLFAILARFNALVTPALYIWGSPALRGAKKSLRTRLQEPNLHYYKHSTGLSIGII
ncbi:hypothetical protein J4Q44_G00237020 [Coregonus suidteri]|uniref:G-protein coupled receptors family 1 profile domain-containing protein n=1 Tax=Coregonus suidteri TaxID=861788 RepID=A0AAN8LE89_9TELE